MFGFLHSFTIISEKNFSYNMSIHNVDNIKACFKQIFVENDGSMIFYSEHFMGQWAEEHMKKKSDLKFTLN
jgi:hypothetical protein